VKKVRLGSRNPLSAILHYLEDHPTDLIVLSTEGRDGLPRWIKPSLAERIAEKSETMTLFVPKNTRGFVSPDNGDFTMRRVLVPVDDRPYPQPAIISAARIAVSTSHETEIIVLHVGDSSTMPDVKFIEDPSLTWKTIYAKGNVLDEIIKAANEYEVNLTVMATTGRDGILDTLRGTITEQVLRRSPSTLLAVPCI
jgi:nucleotide-binding universal stress UspA family protein